MGYGVSPSNAYPIKSAKWSQSPSVPPIKLDAIQASNNCFWQASGAFTPFPISLEIAQIPKAVRSIFRKSAVRTMQNAASSGVGQRS